jgi:chromate transport protein ChrA
MGPVAHRDTEAPGRVGFGEALRFWLKLGFIGFGGPAGQIAVMHEELVERRFVFWPAGSRGRVDWIAVAMAVAAAIALLRFKLNVITVILVSAMLGPLIQVLG